MDEWMNRKEGSCHSQSQIPVRTCTKKTPLKKRGRQGINIRTHKKKIIQVQNDTDRKAFHWVLDAPTWGPMGATHLRLSSSWLLILLAEMPQPPPCLPTTHSSLPVSTPECPVWSDVVLASLCSLGVEKQTLLQRPHYGHWDKFLPRLFWTC